MNDTSPGSDSIAAIDLGSNSFHMVVARSSSGELLIVDKLREMVQLAAGLDEKRVLSRDARNRALDCLRRFGERVGPLPHEAVRAVGTNTLRSARNAEKFLAEAREALGHPIETISGIEEARLIYQGVAHGLPDPDMKRLVLDIGGGSTELIIGRDFKPGMMESLYVGCVSLTRQFFPDGEITAERWDQATTFVRQEFEPVQRGYRKEGWEQAVGASGTVRSIAAVISAGRFNKKEGITLKAMKRLRDLVLSARSSDLLKLEGLSTVRRHIFPAGLLILISAFEALKIQRMQAADGALREGLLYDLLGRMRETDIRSRSVRWLGERYHVDWDHAARVERTADLLLGQVAKSWGLDDRTSRLLLSWAATLHEVGLDIAHQHFHKHGEYIVAQTDLHGFTREEQRMLATLVRAHRRKFPLELIGQLPPHRVREAERLAILLRIAVLLNRSRTRDVPEPEIGIGKRKIELSLPRGWADAHALTRADLQQEAAFLKVAGYKLEWK